MHDIVLIESIKLTKEENIQLVAILENVDASIEAKNPKVVPTFAPLKCRTTIDRAAIPHWLNLKEMDEDELEDVINRYTNLNKQEWEAMLPKFKDHNPAPK